MTKDNKIMAHTKFAAIVRKQKNVLAKVHRADSKKIKRLRDMGLIPHHHGHLTM